MRTLQAIDASRAGGHSSAWMRHKYRVARGEARPLPDAVPMPDIAWQSLAACRSNPEVFYVPDREQWVQVAANREFTYAAARAICDVCPVKPECKALADRYEAGQCKTALHGMWGGETPLERYFRRRTESG